MARKTLLISIVTYNSVAFIEQCLDGIFRQTFKDFLVSVIDNASEDGTWAHLQRARYPLALAREAVNTGFCAAHNRALRRHADTEYALVLNPDVYMTPTFIEEALKGFAVHSSVGSVSGRLRRIAPERFADTDWHPEAADSSPAILDSTGMRLTTNQRHLDRGADEPDQGQFLKREYIFGASGAAALYRRTMIDDVSVAGEFFDEAFFAYREDADLAWRAQWLGWKCLYAPEAIAYHVRRVRPENREALPPEINYHSVKNRFLMRMKNLDFRTYVRFFLPITIRDSAVIGYVLLKEHRSLPGLWYPLRHWGRFYRARREIMRRRRVTPREVAFWFTHDAAPLKADRPVES